MIRLAFDIETDALLEDCTKLHCLSVKDLRTGVNTLYGPDNLQAGLDHLSTAGWLIAHNGIDFDYQALKKLCGWAPQPTAVVRDSLIWSKLSHLDLDAQDAKSKNPAVRELNGSHSLRAWGIRLDCLKADYEGGFEQYTPEMGAYCQQDVETLAALVRLLESKACTEEALDLEHVVATQAAKMSARGFRFDVEAAEKLCAKLDSDIASISEKISTMIPPTIEEGKTPAYWTMKWDGREERRATRGELDTYRKSIKVKPKDCVFEKGPNTTKTIPFNPASAKQAREYLWEKYKWVSPELTETGEASVGTMPAVELAKQYGSLKEEVLRDLEYPEGKLFADYRTAEKAKSFLLSNKGGGWLTMLKEGRIHHRLDTLGCVTSRCSHSNPNLGQVPGVTKNKAGELLWGLEGRYGADCRSLFCCTPGYVQVGTDISGIEARNLAHFLAPYDGGAYIQEVLNGDIHQLNVNSFAKKAGYNISRGNSKGIYYGWCYGAGDMKLGKLMASPVTGAPEAYQEYCRLRDFYRKSPHKITTKVWSSAIKKRRTAMPEEAAYAAVGSKVSNALETGIGGLQELLQVLEMSAKRGYIRVADRKLPVRSPHAVLNTLLQGFAAIIGKRWLWLLEREATKQGLEYHMLAYVHDEVQSDVLIGHEAAYMPLSVDCIRQAGEWYEMNIPLTGEAKQGFNWAMCH